MLGLAGLGGTMARANALRRGGLELILKALNKFAEPQQFGIARAERINGGVLPSWSYAFHLPLPFPIGND